MRVDRMAENAYWCTLKSKHTFNDYIFILSFIECNSYAEYKKIKCKTLTPELPASVM